MSKHKHLYIIGRYIRIEFPKNALPLFVHLRPNNVLIVKLELKPEIDLDTIKERLLDIISNLVNGFKEHYYGISEEDILNNYQKFLET